MVFIDYSYVLGASFKVGLASFIYLREFQPPDPWTLILPPLCLVQALLQYLAIREKQPGPMFVLSDSMHNAHQMQFWATP